jgi:hypothetical protein
MPKWTVEGFDADAPNLGHVSGSEEKVGLLLERLAARSFSKEENAFPWTEPHLKRLRSP